METIHESVRPLLVGMTGGLVAGILVLDVMVPLNLAGGVGHHLAVVAQANLYLHGRGSLHGSYPF